MRTKRIVVFSLIAFLLFLTSVEVLAHNHPLWQGENSSCPAYILGISVNFEPASPIPSPQLPVPLFEITILKNDQFISQNVFNYFSHRGPPSLINPL